ncbi:MAG TPA: response regulator transcription factor [Chitinophagaceae bacterium]|nr:response regulator transcription factor [Chitinophagaceae bacterium]
MEDSQEYQQALSYWIAESKDFFVGKIFSSAEEAMPFLGQLSGIVIVDIQLPGMNGADLVHHISQQNKSVQSIICSIHDDDAFVFKALKNGALGYLLKDSSAEQIISALRELANGGSPMSSYIARKVIGSFQHPYVVESSALLSERENEVLHQLSQGLIYKEIADRLFISPETVRKHVRNIYKKLHVQNKVEALNKLRDS